ncbi:MAG: hypothetical protein PSV18_08495 [Methylobacter sp.]|nr:hypothetical protein [Candidatus Methylobacter titanis]
MIKRLSLTATMMLTAVSAVAGTITNSIWSPSGCGAEPSVPVIDQASVNAYNKSANAINDWQQKANAYNSCMMNEANSDNAIIANAANNQQARLKAAIEKIQTETTAIKAKLDKK